MFSLGQCMPPSSALAPVFKGLFSEGKVLASEVVPFKGFSNYACPFAFLADRLESAYPIFRAFYCRHLCRLHTISDHPGTLGGSELLKRLKTFNTFFPFQIC